VRLGGFVLHRRGTGSQQGRVYLTSILKTPGEKKGRHEDEGDDESDDNE